MLSHWTVRNHASRVTSGDPSLIFALRLLLCPVLALVSLVIALLLAGEQFAGPYYVLAVLSFIALQNFMAIIPRPGRGPEPRALRQSFMAVTLSWSLVFGAMWALLHVSGLIGGISQWALLTWYVLTPVLIWIGQLVGWRYGLNRVPLRRVVVVGLTPGGMRLRSVLSEDPYMCTHVLGFFEDRRPERHPPGDRQTVLGTTRELPEFLSKHHVDAVYITLPMSRHPRILELMDNLRDSTTSIYFIPDLFEFNLLAARLDQLQGIPVLALRESPMFGASGVAKRACDLLVAGSAALALLPVLLAIAAGVRLSSPGPVVFRQKRYGLDGRPIEIFKFRSMTVSEDGESHYNQVLRNDSRVTKFGAMLRRTSLDELPQIFNVLAGSMSIVGPRPHVVRVNEEYRKLIPGYMIRHKIKPGITGWAQVHGFRGGDDYESMSRRVQLDLEYVANWSLRLDFVILMRTLPLLFLDRKAF